MINQPGATPFAPEGRRAGTYDDEADITALLRFGTSRVHDLDPGKSTYLVGRDSCADISIDCEHVSSRHALLERHARGLVLRDIGSTNGVAIEATRSLGAGLRASFEDRRVPSGGAALAPGTTFVVGVEPWRFVALDRAMRDAYSTLAEILPADDELSSLEGDGDAPTASTMLLAASGPENIVITGQAGCKLEDLAREIHRVSKRRSHALVELDVVPHERAHQADVLRRGAKGTVVLHLGKQRDILDRSFVASLFSSAYQIRLLVIARTANQARRALGHGYWRTMMHVALAPLKRRRAAIPRIFDGYLSRLESPLRFGHLTEVNQRALIRYAWPENLVALRLAAERLDAIARAPAWARSHAADALGMIRQTFYSWFSNTMRFSKPLTAADPEGRSSAPGRDW